MKIGVLTATNNHEKRVALTPDAIKKLSKLGFSVIVQSGAGQHAYYNDKAYEQAGATIATTDQEVLTQADYKCSRESCSNSLIELYTTISVYLFIHSLSQIKRLKKLFK